MSCSAWPVQFTRTVTGTWEVQVDDVVNHVLWYQNRVGAAHYVSGVVKQIFEVIVRQGMAGAPWNEICKGPMMLNNIEEREVESEIEWRAAGKPPRGYDAVRDDLPPEKKSIRGNCLIIPINGHWKTIKLLDTSKNPSLLSDINRSLQYGESTEPNPSPVGGGSGGSSVVFMQFDIYDIILAESAKKIHEHLEQIDIRKRPEVNDEVFRVLNKWYKCPVAVCCFDNWDSGESKPIGFAFEPLDPENLTVYTLDGSSGMAPDIDKEVELDHTVFVGSYLTDQDKGAKVEYTENIPEHLAPYVLDSVLGKQINGYMKNGDIVFPVSKVREGVFEGTRILPPFAPQESGMVGEKVVREEPYQKLDPKESTGPWVV